MSKPLRLVDREVNFSRVKKHTPPKKYDDSRTDVFLSSTRSVVF